MHSNKILADTALNAAPYCSFKNLLLMFPLHYWSKKHAMDIVKRTPTTERTHYLDLQ
jgi:hypothetical protein